jgi:hypothetical protein
MYLRNRVFERNNLPEKKMIGFINEPSRFSIIYWSTSPFSVTIVLILLETNSTSPALLPPLYRNFNLEQIIMNQKDAVKIDLRHKSLTAQDMEIVVYYLLKNSKVSQMMFSLVISENSNILTVAFFRENGVND